MKVTAIFFSCRRLKLLDRTIETFNEFNTHPLYELIIVNDSGDKVIHQQLKKLYPDYTLVLNRQNVGLVKSIDLGYKHIKTEYFFHSEDDFLFVKSGFIEDSLAIMKENDFIEEVWLGNWNSHPVEPGIWKAGEVEYRILQENHMRGDDGNAWHGFSMACGLKRHSDYRQVAPYYKVKYHDTIWHREQAIGEVYHKLGYRTAIFLNDYVQYNGMGQSEYITGYER